ncbi:hypothetical protein [Catenovulum maritimum]|uniref:Uncharacterized protein n=1 Tax=Catenovulum maritimum TaxID=1513271 RepID=A0A0J8JJI6_9ALTE|nr:hypothetical protein [Catenovulum maritimum]KMT64606.1 hypothetical protein XM47_13245 [Catenovulum maritimum]
MLFSLPHSIRIAFALGSLVFLYEFVFVKASEIDWFAAPVVTVLTFLLLQFIGLLLRQPSESQRDNIS